MNIGQDQETKSGKSLLLIGALGVVFGDIGTSPLYALRECFGHEYGLTLTPDNLLGVLSLIVWAMTAVITVKYMAVILRADNKGEGGILSLMALAMRTLNTQQEDKSRKRWFLIVLGIFGAALLYGDGIITPAISVLSAIEGLELVTPLFSPYVIPITIFIINALFLAQRYGTGKIGVVFGPIILLWFIVIGVLGGASVLQNPEVLRSINPIYAVQFFIENQSLAFLILGSVVLVVTGGEALYADMGHFGREPIRQAWFFVAMPGLLLNYLGQGAMLLSNPESVVNPFYALAPKWALIPLIVLSTLAAVIASQALISGVFSLTRQAIQLGYWPRLNIVHTSSSEMGQIYIPAVNWAMFVGVIWLVITFGSSSRLAAAYGIAVTATMVITTILAFEVSRQKWNWSLQKSLTVFGFFLIVDLAFFGANILKIGKGGWVPLVIGVVMYTLMMTWFKGRKLLYKRLKKHALSEEEFCAQLLEHPPLRVPGTAVYMSGDPYGVPVPLLHNLRHNKTLHQRVALLTIRTLEVPVVKKDERVEVREIIPHFYRIVASYGFMETPKMKHILDACRNQNIHIHLAETTFVLGRETILVSPSADMPLWQEKIFAIMSQNAQRPTKFFKIPPNQVVEVGLQVEL